jgi:hypothetical protein
LEKVWPSKSMMTLVDTSKHEKRVKPRRSIVPVIFDIGVHILAIIKELAKTGGQIEGVVPHPMDGGLSILQYVDEFSL